MRILVVKSLIGVIILSTIVSSASARNWKDYVDDIINVLLGEIETRHESKNKTVNKTVNKNVNKTKIENKNKTKIKTKKDAENKMTKHIAFNYMTTPQLISSNGYPVETHTVVTEDEYVLEVHRIPYSENSLNISSRKTILLHHGILGSSADWVLAGPENGLAYILSKESYDVWMANARGNEYSKSHLSKNVCEFWDFTFHEIGLYDLPALIEYIMNIKGADVEINYVGFSMGATVLFSMLSTKPQYNKYLNAAFLLAPIVYTSNVKSPIRLLVNYSQDMEWKKVLGEHEFLPDSEIIELLSNYAKTLDSNNESILHKNLFFILCGYNSSQFNNVLIPTLLNHIPSGTSSKTIIHYAQEIKNKGEFQQFDFGPEGNLEQYGSYTPPTYHLERVTIPVALISAKNDWLSDHQDVRKLYDELPNSIEHYKVPHKYFNHIDFLFGKRAPTLVFDKLLDLLEAYSKDVVNSK